MLRMLKNWIMKLMGMPSCQEIEQFAYDYLEGQLEPGRVRNFERHLQGCANCKRFVDSYKKVAWPEQLAQNIPLDPDFEERVVEFLTKESN